MLVVQILPCMMYRKNVIFIAFEYQEFLRMRALLLKGVSLVTGW